jgi:hypothetical protein
MPRAFVSHMRPSLKSHQQHPGIAHTSLTMLAPEQTDSIARDHHAMDKKKNDHEARPSQPVEEK